MTRYVQLRRMTAIEARVLYGVLAAWCNEHHRDEPMWPTVNSLRFMVRDEYLGDNDMV